MACNFPLTSIPFISNPPLFSSLPTLLELPGIPSYNDSIEVFFHCQINCPNQANILRNKLLDTNDNSNLYFPNERPSFGKPYVVRCTGSVRFGKKLLDVDHGKNHIQLVQVPAQLPASKSHSIGFGVPFTLLFLLLLLLLFLFAVTLFPYSKYTQLSYAWLECSHHIDNVLNRTTNE